MFRIAPRHSARCSRRRRGSRGVVTLALLVLGIGAGAGCQRADGPPVEDLETVVVEAPPEDAIDISVDTQGRRSAEGIAGVLPGNFPRDLPLFEPATLVDFGVEGDRYVTFTSPATPGAVRRSLEQRLLGAGWTATGGGGEAAEASGTFERQGRRVRLSVESDPAGSLWRLDY